jgi:DNA polymerase-3 subunit gamma/tau
MLEMVADLERNGHHLQHFCRELARYFRNLLVAKLAGRDTRLIAASPTERTRLGEIAESFSEQDLTRYLQITLDLYGDLQRSTQPRLHMELGLLRMIEAGRLMPIEQALAMLAGGSTPPTPPAPPATPRGRSEPPPAKTAAPNVPEGGLQEKLHGTLMELGQKFTADAVAHSRVTEAEGALRFETPKEFKLSMREADLRKALEQVGAGSMKVHISFVESGPPAGKSPKAEGPSIQGDQATTGRALAHPEVQRFQETFGGQVRAVRNLKE